MWKRNQFLRDKQIEEELENIFGIPDGSISEDDEENLSDAEGTNDNRNLLSILVGKDVMISSAAEERQESPVLAQSPRPSTSRAVNDSPSVTTRVHSPSLENLSDFSSSSDEESDADEIEWKKQSWQQSPNLESFDDSPLRCTRNLPNRTRPVTYFELFFDVEVMDNIMIQTNKYAEQENARNWTPVTVNELKAFLGIIIQMGIHVLPTIEDYWSSNPLLQVVEIAETMTLQRFQKILKFLHINDNLAMPSRTDENYDKLYKVRPLVDRLNNLCQSNASITNSQSIDECMIKFKGRSSLKQYMPMKPVKRGYKVWCRADSSTGYLYQFQVYTGKTDTAETGLGSNVVKSLCEPLLQNGYSGHMAFDNFFSSFDLLQHLYEQGVYSTATIRSDRVDLPLLVKKPKKTGNREEDERISVAASKASTKVKKLKKGKWKWRVKKNVGFAVWKDTKQVNVVSTAFHPKEKRNCNRTQKDGSKKSIRCPLLIPEYTKRMGGVDRFDQLRTHYAVGRRSRKWWTRIFYFFIDVAITNAYLIYKTNTRVHSVMSQKEFRIALSRELVDNQTFRKRSFQTMPKHITKKKKRVEESDERQKRLYGVPEDVRYQKLGDHWPIEIDTYKRCRYCSTKINNKRSKIECERCKVALCIYPCFKLFHQLQEENP